MPQTVKSPGPAWETENIMASPHLSTLGARMLSLVAATGVVVVALLSWGSPQSASAAAGTCTRYWTGAASTAWEVAGNWSATDGGAASTVPTASDVACISTSPARTTVVVSDSRQVAGVTFPANGSVLPTLRVTGSGSLQVGGTAPNSYDSVVRSLDLQSGSTLGGSAPVTASSIGSLSGVTLGMSSGSSQGSLVLAPGASTTLASGEVVYVNGGYTFENNGSVTTNNGYVYYGYDAGGGGAPSKVRNGGSWTVTNTSNDPFYDPYGHASLVNAAGGTMAFTAPTSAGSVPRSSVPLVNNGLLNVTRGHVANSVDGTGTGTYNLATGTSYDHNGGTLTLTGTQFTGPGTFNLNGGTLTTPNATSTAALPTTTKLHGGTLQGGGTFTVPSAGTAVIANGESPVLDQGTTLDNLGSVTTNNGYLLFGYYAGAGDAPNKLINHGTWTTTNTNNDPFYSPYGHASLLNAAGATLNFSPALASDTASRNSTALTNNGTVNVTKGHVANTVDATGTGTYNLATGTSYDHNGGTLTLTGTQFTGPGTFNLNGGTLTTPNATSTAALPTTTKLHGGTLQGGGTFTVPSAGTAVIASGESPILDQGTTLDNLGSVTTNNGYILFGYYAGTGDTPNKLINHGTWTATNTNNDPFYSPYGHASLLNATGGTLNFSPALASDTVARNSTALTNNGTVNVTKGHVANAVDGTGTGTYNLATGTSYDHNGATLDLTGSTWAGPGTFNLSGGNVTGTGSLAPVTALHSGSILGGGTITVPSGGTATIAANESPTLDQGTTLTNNGTTSIGGNGYLFYGYNLGTAGQLNRVVNNGTWTFSNASQAPLYNPYGDRGTFTNGVSGIVTAAPGSGNTLDLTTVPFTNDGELKATSGTTTVSPTNLTTAGVLNNGTLTTQGGILNLPNAIVTNKGVVTVVSGGINTAGASALPALRSNTGSLTLTPSVTLTGPMTNAGTVWLKGGTFRGNSYTQSGGSTRVDPGATLKAGTTGTAAVAINAGTLLGGGTVQGVVSNGGVVQPGAAGNPLTVTGSYTQASGGVFGATINGTATPGTDFSKLVTSGAATLSGRLSIGTAPAFDPPVGTSVRILEAGSRSSTFSSVEGIDSLPTGKYWRAVYDGTGVSLRVVADPVASVGSASTAEGDTGTATVTFPVTLDQASDRPVSIDYSTVDQTATAPSDYASASGTLTFAPGETSKSVAVTVNGDATFEPDETFLVRLSGPSNASIGTNDGTGTITNDDPEPPRVAVTALSPSSLGQGATAVSVTVTGSGFDPTSTVTVANPRVTPVAGSTEYVDATTMRVQLTVTNATLGATDVTVSGANGTATCTGCLTVTAKPVVTSTDMSFLGRGAKSREITINGSGFKPGAVAKIGGATVSSTSYIDPTTLEALVTVSPTSSLASVLVSVTNPDAGKGNCYGCFTIIDSPEVTSMSRTTFTRGTTTEVTLRGTNFTPGVKVVGPSGVVFDGVTRVDATTITATASTSTRAVRGTTRVLTVINAKSGGYGSSTYGPLTVE